MKKLLFLAILILASSLSHAQECMKIGVNFHDIQYWSNSENPLKDEMKQSGEFLGFYDFNWDNEVMDVIPVDEDGYPNAGVPYITDLGGTIGTKDLFVRKMISSQGRLPQIELVFLYDGDGSISIQGDIEITSSTSGRIELTCTGDNNIYLVINQSEAAPNNVRNFRLVSISDEDNYETNRWKQNFLDRLEPFSSIRMMDWTQTNSCSIWQWEQRTTATYHTQNEKSGMAYEYIIELCNSQNKDLWLCVPHMANPDYITQMATLFKNSLNPDLEIYLEYSNETWNWLFDQTPWIIDDFTWLDPSYPHNELYVSSESQPYNSGLLAKRAFQLWRAAYGADSLKVNRVLGCQAANPWVAEEKIRAVGDYYDFLSPAWYFGANPSFDFSLGVNAKTVVDSSRAEFFNIYWDSNLAHYSLAEQYGKKVVCYEGGQHITAFGDENFHGLQAFYDAQVHPDIYDLYDDVIDTLRHFKATMLMAYTLGGGGNSIHGSWGHLADIDMVPTMENAPKYMALIDNIDDCDVVAVDDISSIKTAAISIYPNPSTGIVEVFSQNTEYQELTVFNILGNIVFRKSINGSRVNLDLSHLANGTYLISILTSKGIVADKVVLQK